MTYDDWKTRDDTPEPEPDDCATCRHEQCDCPCCNEWHVPDPGMRLCRACKGSGTNDDTYRGGDLVDRYELCLACGGDGQFSDVRTARDAMVDAETLRRHVAHLALSGSRRGERLLVDLTFAHLECLTTEERVRAAFRAVPALREDA